MELQSKNFLLPSTQVVSFLKRDVSVPNSYDIVSYIDTSIHKTFSVFIKNKTANACSVKVEIADVDENGNEIGWTEYIAPQTVPANGTLFLENKTCMTKRTRLQAQNNVSGNIAVLDIFVRLSPYF
ncbi:MAG: hypothetical protein QXG00_04185 [Candidatus Woesearchaeota archaeon]